MLVPTAIACLVGFVISGAVAIPALAGWGLLLGSVVAALLASPRLGWFPVVLPPLAMLTVVAVLGQITVFGSRPTLVREAALIVAGLAGTAPAQALSVLAVGGILWLRRTRVGSPPAAGA